MFNESEVNGHKFGGGGEEKGAVYERQKSSNGVNSQDGKRQKDGNLQCGAFFQLVLFPVCYFTFSSACYVFSSCILLRLVASFPACCIFSSVFSLSFSFFLFFFKKCFSFNNLLTVVGEACCKSAFFRLPFPVPIVSFPPASRKCDFLRCVFYS